MDINVNIFENTNFFMPILTKNPTEIRRLLRYYEIEFKDCETEETAALLDFLRDFLEECQKESDGAGKLRNEGTKKRMDTDVSVMIVEPGMPARLMQLPLALELVKPVSCREAELIEAAVPTYDLTMCYNGGQVISIGKEKFLFGKALICKKVCGGFYLPLTRNENHDISRIFEMLTVTLCADGKQFQAFRI